jgi:glycogen debranching enzyme
LRDEGRVEFLKFSVPACCERIAECARNRYGVKDPGVSGLCGATNEKAMSQEIIQVENKYCISVNSSYADDRVRILNHVDTFGIFDRWGDVKQMGEEVQGIYHRGMRFISDLEFRINGFLPLLLSSAIKEANEILSVDLTNPAMPDVRTGQFIPKGLLYIGRSKFVRNGACYEEMVFNNFGHETYEFEVSLQFDADFKDIFEVRGIRREHRGEVYEILHLPDNRVMICYEGLDKVRRFTRLCLCRKPDIWEQHSKAVFRIRLAPHERVALEYSLQFLTADEEQQVFDFRQARALMERDVQEGQRLIGTITTGNEQFNQWITRSRADLHSLLAATPSGKYPYAGVPWYNTAFGRDGIITALQTLWIAPDIARGVLRFLADTQATEEDAYRDAAPGKIVHEVRDGEMVALREVPFGRYYGTVDATPLFIVLAGAYYRRTADLPFLRELWPHIEAALNWIDKYGDIDGDGFVDYHHKSVNGLFNQGWKDSHDSISDEHGNLAEPPIALCEVQGYVYDAKMQAAALARVLGDEVRAATLEAEAATLKKRFNEQFWDEKLQLYVLALDGKKRPCRVRASNAGHSLFSGIADKDKAERVARELLQPDMFSGWGVRTLSTGEQRYNPMSYHNGSVWPHDVAMIARGCARYGLDAQTLELTAGLFDASVFLELQRLPELFCGFTRRRGEGPTDYPVACSPQAWSVGAVYMLLDACLHIDIDAAEKKVYFRNPVMPTNMRMIDIHNLKLGSGFARIQLYCEHDAVGLRVRSCPEGWQVLLVTA